MSDRRRELFPPDRRLQACMAVSVVVGLAAFFGLVGVWLFAAPELAAIVLSAGVVMGVTVARRSVDRWPNPDELRAVLGRVQPPLSRLCLLADLAEPRIAVACADAPLSWTTAVPGDNATVHVTTGLLNRLADDRLEAVLAHELSHIANHDAVSMTVVGGPPSWFFVGVRDFIARQEYPAANPVVWLSASVWMPVAALVLPGFLAARIASRQRELAADRGAAVLTGSPARVAATLMCLSGEMMHIPLTDLRRVRGRDPFHILPARRDEPQGLLRLVATHPPLAKRVAELERMERALQEARPTLAHPPLAQQSPSTRG